MIKKLYKLIEKFILSTLVLYTYNLIAAPLNLIIPINIITILILMTFGTKALFSLIAILIIIY